MNQQEETVRDAMPPQDERGAGRAKYALFTLRAVVAFLILAAVIALLGWLGYNAYPTVGEWSEPGNHDALVYDGATYYWCGRLGERGLAEKKYGPGEMLGKIKDDGVSAVTEAVTASSEGETVNAKPPKADPTLATQHTYMVYSVKNYDNLLLVLESDGERYVYYREGTDNPMAQNS